MGSFNPSIVRQKCIWVIQAGELIGKSTPATFHDTDEVALRAGLRAAGMSVNPDLALFTVRARQISGGILMDGLISTQGWWSLGVADGYGLA